MYEMKYLKEEDIPYFRRLTERGKAVIIELSDNALFQIDPGKISQSSGQIDRKNMEEILLKQEQMLQEKCWEGERLNLEIREMEKLLNRWEPVSSELKSLKEDSDVKTKQLRELIEDMIGRYAYEISLRTEKMVE